MSAAAVPGMLAGVRVLDLSRLLPGPFATEALAELGATVVKVEPPGGDPARVISPAVFEATNARKTTVTLDLRAPEGVAQVLRLARESDVLVDSFKPGILDAMGLTDAALDAANPRLVRLSLVGYAPGEWRDDPGHDINYQALGGALVATGIDDTCHPGALLAADLSGALYGALAVCAALVERGRTGKGRRIEVALADAVRALNVAELASGGDNPLRGGALPCYRVYACRDGKRVALGALESKFWARFVEAATRPDLAEWQFDVDSVALVEALFRERDADAWVALLRAAGVPATPVLDADEVLSRFGVATPGAPIRHV